MDLLERVADLHTILESLKKRSMEDNDLVMYAQDIARAEAILSRAEDGIDTELEIWNSVQLESIRLLASCSTDQCISCIPQCDATSVLTNQRNPSKAIPYVYKLQTIYNFIYIKNILLFFYSRMKLTPLNVFFFS